MSRFPEKVRTKVKKSLTRRGIYIHSGSYVETIESKTVILASGKRHDLDVIFLALGVRPNRLFKESGLPTGPDGGLLVNAYLQCTAHPEIFGGGDCIYFEPQPLDKVGVYAVRENPILYANLMAALDGKPLQPFDPGGDYLLIFKHEEVIRGFAKEMASAGVGNSLFHQGRDRSEVHERISGHRE